VLVHRRMGKSVANPWNAGSFNPDPSPKYGLSTRFFMLSLYGDQQESRRSRHVSTM
jgi:hypothetical protein